MLRNPLQAVEPPESTWRPRAPQQPHRDVGLSRPPVHACVERHPTATPVRSPIMASPAVPNPPSPQAVMAHIRKLSDPDPDFRFMALNDLLQLLNISKPDFLHHDYNIAARAVDSVIKTLDDQNSEVQNLAINLGPLVGKVPATILPPMIDKLSSLKLKNAVDNTVPSLALRSVVTALPRPVPGLPVTSDVKQAYDAIHRVLIPRLIGPGPKTQVPDTTIDLPAVPTGLLQDEESINGEAVDVLIDLVRCFGPLLQSVEVEATVQVVMQLLESTKGTSVVKKRAVVAISMLAVYVTDDQLEDVIQRLTTGLAQASTSAVTRKLYIAILGSMARSIPVRFGPHISKAAPFVLQALSDRELEQHLEKISDGEDLGQDFNEIRESALVALEAFLASCPQEMRLFTDEVISSIIRYVKYDPNYAVDDDEDMEVDDEDEDADDDDFEEDDGFEDDDDDASWKVRRCAVKAMYTLIATRGSGDLLDNGVLYSQAAPLLVKRIDEREENVRLEVISALSLLIRKTGEGLHMADLSLDEMEAEPVGQMPLSRKRRRQSSGGSASASRFMAAPGLTSPVLEKVPPTGPRADLSRLMPSIVKAGTKQLKAKTVPTRQSIINMFDDLVSVQRGGLSDYFADIVGPITAEAKSSISGNVSSSLASAGGSSSATPSTLRIAALRLISDICKTHSSSLLQPYLSKIVAAVTAAVHDRFYKISSDALRTAEELVKTITPPRSRNAGTKYKAELEKLYEVILDRGSANDADAEVRQRAIHALGVLVSRTSSSEGSELLSDDKRKVALEVLKDRLKNETTRLAAVRAVDNVAAFAVTPGQLSKDWIQNVALELSSQLRKANRSLRGSSVVALKHLVLSKAAQGQLEPSTIQGIVTALMPAVTNSDTHLLGPALLILANMVQTNPALVVTEGMVAALCQLLKSHFASIVLDQLLELMDRVGQSGTAGQLMRGLLNEVSVLGDPSVVGKVIGTLLVTGGNSTGVSLDSFVSELQTSAQTGDDARVSLALAVLGEAGFRLGAKSPLEPDLFLAQFHAEPDKVSLAAAIALGRAGSGNVSKFLPVILKTMQQGGNTQYLLIQSIKEVLQSIPVQSTDLRDYALAIWEQLLAASENADNRVVCAECAGRLVILDPSLFMPKLEQQTLLKAKSPGIRGMAVQAVRYTLPESDDAFDAMLKSTLISMLLVMLQDSDMEIRRLAMSTLNSAAHNKPDLILPHLGDLVPFVLSESVIKPELIKEVLLGPFKHLVDDGLEVRKSAYETLYALMETAFTRMNNIDFYDRVVAGLKDDNDIRQLCNLMVTKLIVIDPDETARRLDSIAEAYRGVLSVKLKDNAVKQDIEKQEEANKSVLRVTLLLGDKMKAMTGNAGAATSNAGAAGVWTLYWEWVNKEFEKQLKSLREETKELQTRMV
ncbi:cullin binding protein CanA [Purpureocillium lavendulum]|uniref:Cullin binding protein CanA n=1 Tax=Purpureocillium lavendulum TaxID=1247861 RepID=A0AB34FLI9_9HYPO|nr:cullin binding protein CanA [Purpureocillium lavendulum]